MKIYSKNKKLSKDSHTLSLNSKFITACIDIKIKLSIAVFQLVRPANIFTAAAVLRVKMCPFAFLWWQILFLGCWALFVFPKRGQ